jgi:hypothetical protein
MLQTLYILNSSVKYGNQYKFFPFIFLVFQLVLNKLRDFHETRYEN